MALRPDNLDYYELLHVSRGAPCEIIQTSYRTLMQQMRMHPDLGGDTEKAALINEAYRVLTNPDERAAYDARLKLLARVAGSTGFDPTVTSPDVQPRRVLDPSRECVFCETPHSHGTIVEVSTNCTTCRSPLVTARKQRIELSDQRAVARIDKKQWVTFYTHWPQRRAFAGQTEDVSLNGMRLVTRHELQAGQRIKIMSDVLEAIATVTNAMHERRAWRSQWVAGLSFVTLRFARAAGGFVSERA